MKEYQLNLCPECGIPEQVTKERIWLNSGVIVHARNMARRISFIEIDTLDPLFHRIAEISGRPIECLVLDMARKDSCSHARNIIAPEVRGIIRSRLLSIDVMIDALLATTQLRGYGKYEAVEVLYEGDPGDHMTIRVSEPFSKLIVCGNFVGTCEGLLDYACDFASSEVSSDVQEITVYAAEGPQECEEPLQTKEYCHRDGDIELARCGKCGAPVGLSDFMWHLDRGIITDSTGSRRMAMIGPQSLDGAFDQLERQSGKPMTMVVVEAQRQLAKAMSKRQGNPSREELRCELALRGLGNLKEFEMDRRGLRMRLDNTACCPIVVGNVQALFETRYDTESQVEWELSENGDLRAEVTAKTKSLAFEA